MTFQPSVLQHVPTKNKRIFLHTHSVIMSPKTVSTDTVTMSSKNSISKNT